MQKTTSLPTWSTETAQIPLNNGLFAIIDATDFYELSRFHWTTRRSHSNIYAIRKYKQYGRSITVFMHRSLLHAQPGAHVHHINHNCLDNRRSNLELLSPSRHRELHALDRITSKNQPKTGGTPQTYM